MPHDPTEAIRRVMLETGQPARDLEAARANPSQSHVWDHETVRDYFEITGFLAPFCMAIRKSDGARGTLEFVHHPRMYFNFVPDKP